MRDYRFLFLSLMIIWGGINVYAQQYQLKGKVVGSTSNNPVEWVNVVLVKNDSVFSGTTTDSLGVFLITAPKGIYTLKLEQFGETVTNKAVDLSNDIDFGVLKIRESVQLKEIVINTRRKIIKQVGDKLQFDIENSPFAEGNTGLDILKKSPKLSVTSSGGIMLKNKSVEVLVNGRKMNLSSDELGTYLQSLSSEDIKVIEIQEMASADQEAATQGGVINIILKNNPKGIRVIAKSSYLHRKNNFGTYQGGLNLNYGTEQWNLYSDFSYAKNRDSGTSRGTFYYKNGNSNDSNGDFIQDNNNIGIRLGTMYYLNDKNTLGIEGYFSTNQFEIDSKEAMEIISPTMNIQSKNQSLWNLPSDLWYTTFNYTLKTDEKGSSLKLIADMGENQGTSQNNVSSIYDANSSLNSNHWFTSEARSKYYTAQLDAVQKWDDDWELNAGAKFNAVSRDNLLNVKFLQSHQWIEDISKKQDFDNQEQILAGYTTLAKVLGKHFLKVGVRLENTKIEGVNKINQQKVDQEYTRWFPTLYYKYNFGNQKSISASYRKSISRPSFKDLNPFIFKQNDFLYQIGNANLQPFYKDLVDIEMTYKNHSLSLYAAYTKDLITNVYYTDTNHINYYQPKNFGNYKEWGLDYSYAGNITKWLYTSMATGIFYNSFQSGDGVNTSGASFYGTMYNDIQLPNQWGLELYHSYHHSRISKNLKAYEKYYLDVSIRKKFLDNKLLLVAGVDDIFNTLRDRNISYFNDFDFEFYQKRLTRSFFLSFTYTFDNHKNVSNNKVKSENESRQRF
ncbi:outer membrane beta-barrel protein [Riemerella columbina]|uniref:outer membrane beta-barrel protein n=1 Tax=Riemerella columbina TaxID=103810 RepID=UPI00266FC836|nr:outer membrane beta-barrel protein [Riemerella columbina]WKS95395.1 TonB-dependent receptor [Riemerella columbina]